MEWSRAAYTRREREAARMKERRKIEVKRIGSSQQRSVDKVKNAGVNVGETSNELEEIGRRIY